ncbi:MAG: hypothetical protein ACJAS4_001837 [Bacteriovoracaceae bacterium]|jgi:uncharacterized protein (TIGR02687 family)
MSNVKIAIEKLLEKHRIVFWYDHKKDLKQEFNELEIHGVEKIEVYNNEFGIKHKVLRKRPNDKFIIYKHGDRPHDLDNWLLDLELRFGEFRGDKESLWLGELGLSFDYSSLIKEHIFFFKKKDLREKLKKTLDISDNENEIRYKMLSVCVGAGTHIHSVLEELLYELARDEDDRITLVKEANLDKFLWKALRAHFGYNSTSPSLKDFVVELFKSSYLKGFGEKTDLTNDSLVFIRRWKDSRSRHKDFEILSHDCADGLNIDNDLVHRDYSQVLELDYFKVIDQKIISSLIRDLSSKTLSAYDCIKIIKARRPTHWYNEFKNEYEAIFHYCHFFILLKESNLSVPSLKEGVISYCENWYKIDLNYRKYIYCLRESSKNSLLSPLTIEIENFYSNEYLLKINDSWQQHIDKLEKWSIAGITGQQEFFKKSISSTLAKKKKVFVIISDALRFEAGKELVNRIEQEDRYECKIEPNISVLPSYTQLGMAALLPHEKLSFSQDKADIIFADGLSTQGTANRSKILTKYCSDRSEAMKIENFMKLSNEDARNLIKNNDVIYFYHNEIDKTGDDKSSEDRVFDAVEGTFNYLIKAIKKLTGANANKIIITSDHGFIYQNNVLDESDFIQDSTIKGDIQFTNRRFLIGRDFKEHSSFKHFTAKDINLDGNMEIMIPKSINRLRQRGSGSRFVHGGASLQEVITPVLFIKKKRQSDISYVGVEIIRGASSVISSGQISVTFYQNIAVTNKERPLHLRAGIYCGDILISDEHDFIFDMVSDNPRDREKKVQFILAQEANNFNNEEVKLKLFEKIKGTERFEKLYSSLSYTLRRSFTTDFDF